MGKHNGHQKGPPQQADGLHGRRTHAASAADFVPPHPTLSKLRVAAANCRGCALWKVGTQTVFGEGPRTARVLVVGEQPGDQEDKEGKPFVGPSGRLLDKAFDSAGIAREDVYVTNAVKHFNWAHDSRSKRRIHKTPSAGEIRACFPWLQAEITLIKPEVIVCLGATAAKALLGRNFSVTKMRGVPVESELAPSVIATVHPSAVLRAPREERERNERAFIADIRRVARHLEKAETAEKVPKRARAGRRGTSTHRLAAWQTTEQPSATSSASTRSSRR